MLKRKDIERMVNAPECFVPTIEVVRELARLALMAKDVATICNTNLEPVVIADAVDRLTYREFEAN